MAETDPFKDEDRAAPSSSRKKIEGPSRKATEISTPQSIRLLPPRLSPLTEREPRSVLLLTVGADGTSRWVPRPKEVCLLAVRSALSVLVFAALELSRRSDSGTALKTKRRTADGRTHLTPHVVSVQRLSPNRTNEKAKSCTLWRARKCSLSRACPGARGERGFWDTAIPTSSMQLAQHLQANRCLSVRSTPSGPACRI